MSADTAYFESARYGRTGWRVVSFSQILAESPRNGLSPSSSGTVSAKVLTLSAVTGPRFDGSAYKISTFKAAPPAKQSVRKQDFLICRGNGNKQLVGRGYFPISDMPDTTFPDTIIAARVNPDIIVPEYLEILWSAPVVRRQIEAAVRTTNGTLKINQHALEAIKVIVPPIEEQRAIAAVLGRLKQLRRDRQRSIALLGELSRSIFLDMFGDPVENSRDWDRLPLTEVCHPYSGGTPSKSRTDFWTGQIPWFSPKDLKADDLFDAQDHVSEAAITGSLKLLPENTVAIVVRGMILAHTFPVSVLRVPGTINQDLKALLPKVDIEPQFLAACLRNQSSYALSQVSTSAHGTCRIDSGGLEKIGVLLPPTELQRAFAERIAGLEVQKAAHEAHLANLDELFDSLQHEIFEMNL